MRRVLHDERRIPQVTRGDRENLRRLGDTQAVARTGNRIEERLPEARGFLTIEALKQHRNTQRADGAHRYRLAPMLVKKTIRAECEKAVDQTTECLGRRLLDRCRYNADIVGQRMRLQR